MVVGLSVVEVVAACSTEPPSGPDDEGVALPGFFVSGVGGARVNGAVSDEGDQAKFVVLEINEDGGDPRSHLDVHVRVMLDSEVPTRRCEVEEVVVGANTHALSPTHKMLTDK